MIFSFDEQIFKNNLPRVYVCCVYLERERERGREGTVRRRGGSEGAAAAEMNANIGISEIVNPLPLNFAALCANTKLTSAKGRPTRCSLSH